MPLTDDEIAKMKSILQRLEPDTITSIQYFSKRNQFRTGCCMQVLNKYGKPICILQNFEHLSPYRHKLILRLSKQIPYPIHITHPREGMTRIGWKQE